MSESPEILDERILRVSDLLEQIQSVDAMIRLHESDDDGFMLEQYQYRRAQFLKEMSALLESLNIRPADLAA